MWKKISNRERQSFEISKRNISLAKRTKKALILGGKLFALFFLMLFAFEFIFGKGFSPLSFAPVKKMTLSDIPDVLPRLLAISSTIAILGAIYKFIFLLDIDKANITSCICDKCLKIINYTTEKRCKCGGTIYSLNEFEWIEEDDDKNTTPTIPKR